MKYIYSETDTFNCNISIDDLLQYIDSNKSRYDGSWYIPFIEKWERAIFNCFQQEANKTYNLKNTELFSESVWVNSEEFRFHFDILKAKEYSLNLQPYKISLDTFSEKFDDSSNPDIKYTNPDITDCTYDYNLCQYPILIVNFFHRGFFYLVIDGNHRVAAKKKANISYINGVFLHPRDTLKILTSEFEIAIYLFLYENFLLNRNDFTILSHSNANRYI